jgi:starvation-inducible DNA-binding protein
VLRTAVERDTHIVVREASDSADAATVVVLNDVLAHLLDLGLQARQAHWNVAGPQFASHHEMLGRLAADLDRLGDETAERIVQLGGIADGTLRSIHARSTLNTYPAALDGGAHLPLLAGALAATRMVIRHAIADLHAANDPVTADILTEVLRGVEKWRWYVEAHAEAV